MNFLNIHYSDRCFNSLKSGGSFSDPFILISKVLHGLWNFEMKIFYFHLRVERFYLFLNKCVCKFSCHSIISTFQTFLLKRLKINTIFRYSNTTNQLNSVTVFWFSMGAKRSYMCYSDSGYKVFHIFGYSSTMR